MSGNEHPSNNDPAKAEQETAGLSLLKESSAESSTPADSESLFAQRSGIRDPLVKAPPTEAKEEAGSQAEKPEEAASATSPGSAAGAGKGKVNASAPDPQSKGPPKPQSQKGKSARQLEQVRQRQMNSLHSRRKKKKLRVFYNRLRLIVKLCFAALFGVLLWQFMQHPLWQWDAPRFTMRNQHLVQRAQVEPLLKRWLGKPLYVIDVGQIAHQLQAQFPVIEHVAVRRRLFPARLELQISEKLPWAELYADEKDTRPYGLMADKTPISLAAYPYQTGTYQGRVLDKLIITPKTRYTQSFMHQVQELAWQAHQIKGLHFVSMDVRHPKLITLGFQEVAVILGPLDRNASERLARLIPLVPKVDELKDAINAVDLRWEEQVTFHEKPNASIPKTVQATTSE